MEESGIKKETYDETDNAHFRENVEEHGMKMEEIYCCVIKKETYDETDNTQYSENVKDLGILEGNVEDVDISEQFIDESGVYDRNEYETELDLGICKENVDVSEQFIDDSGVYDKIHLNSRKYEYDFTTHDESVLGRHEDSNHSNSIKLECNSCDDASSEISHPDLHPASVTSRKHKCHLCDYAAKGKISLKKHIDSVHLKLKQHECHLCDYATNQRSNLKVHINSVHLNLRKHKCRSCDYTSNNKSYLKRHIESAHLDSKEHNFHLNEWDKTEILDGREYLAKNENCVSSENKYAMKSKQHRKSNSDTDPDIIKDFEDLKDNFPTRIDSSGWEIKRLEDTIYFYTLSFEESPYVNVSIRVCDNLQSDIFVKNVELSYDDLKWILPSDFTIRRWSQLTSVLSRYKDENVDSSPKST